MQWYNDILGIAGDISNIAHNKRVLKTSWLDQEVLQNKKKLMFDNFVGQRFSVPLHNVTGYKVGYTVFCRVFKDLSAEY